MTTRFQPADVQSAASVLPTKLHPPTQAGLLIARPRLCAKLNASAGRRLVLVSAPAGYGKTALVSQWLQGVDTPRAWLSLDEYDNDLATFLDYVVAAVRTAPAVSVAPIELLLRSPTLPSPNRLADALLKAMAGVEGPFVLAIDDYHLIHAPGIHALMDRVLQHLPPHVQVVLITRVDPPLPLDRMRGRQELMEIRAGDLRFDSEETRLLVQGLLGRGPVRDIAAILEESTEGWAVGLQLAAISLRDREDPVVFARKMGHDGHAAITEYLLSEALAGLSKAFRDCLLRTSLLDRFCASLIDAVQADDGAGVSGDEYLGAMQRANLFVVSLDDEGRWFRYHHLFRSMLRRRVVRRFDEGEVRAMHARAGAWYRSHGFVDEAVVHALESGDEDGAARLVEAQVHPALDRENWHQFEHWIALLPPGALTRPRMLAARAWLHALRYQFATVEELLDAAEDLAPTALTGDPGGDRVFRGEIDVLRAMVAYYRGDFGRTAQMAESALGYLGPDTLYATGQASLYRIWGLQSAGAYDEAIEFAYGQLEAYGLKPNALTLRVLLALVNAFYERADLHGMEEAARVFREVARQSGLASSLAWVHFMSGWLNYQRNDLAAAREAFGLVAEMSIAAHAKALTDAHVGLVLTALAQGRQDDARSAIEALRRCLVEREMIGLTAVADSLEQRLALSVDPTTALDWRPDARATAVPNDFWELPTLTEVRTRLAAGGREDLARAAELLEECRRNALAHSSNRRLIQVRALQALTFALQGDEAAAATALEEAVDRAAAGGALRLLVDCGPGLVAPLRTLRASGANARYVRSVLAALMDPGADPRASAAQLAPYPRESWRGAAETLSDREIDVLLLLAERLTDKEIAQRLVLSPFTVKKHTQRIYRKLGVSDRRAAVAEARRLGCF